MRLSAKAKMEKSFAKATYQYRKMGYTGTVLENGHHPYRYAYHVNQDFNIHYPTTGGYRQIPKPNLLRPAWLGTKFKQGKISAVFLHVTSNLTKTLINYLYEALLRIPVYNICPPSSNVKLKRLEELLVICSFNRTNSKKIMESLPDFSLGEDDGTFVFTGMQYVPNFKLKKWKQLFVVGNYEFEAIVGKGHDGQLLTENFRTDRKYFRALYGDDKVGKARAVPREVTVKVFDDIKFEDQFSSSHKAILEKYTNPQD